MVEIVLFPVIVLAWLLVVILSALALLVLLVLVVVGWYLAALWRKGGFRRGR